MHAFSDILLRCPQAGAASLALATVALALAIPALADEPPASSWSLGLGVMSEQVPYAGMDRETRALPMLRYENRYVQISGLGGRLKLPSLALGDGQQLDFSIVGRYDGSGYEAGDAPILGGMAERKGGFWAGGQVQWSTQVLDVTAEWLGDASGNSKGQKFSLGLEKTWRLNQHMMISPRVEARWHDSKYVDYYFGVRSSEARLGRPAYAGESGTGAELGVRGIYMFDRQHSVLLDVSVASLAKGIKNSPLVNRSTENRVFVGYSYRFQ